MYLKLSVFSRITHLNTEFGVSCVAYFETNSIYQIPPWEADNQVANNFSDSHTT